VQLSEVLRDGEISYRTLVKYTEMGLLSKPQRVWRGRKGSESLYPDDTIDLLKRIRDEQESGRSLLEIAEELREERPSRRSVEPRKEILIPDNPNPLRSYLKARLALHEQMEQENPGYEVDEVEVETIEQDGKKLLKPINIIMRPKERSKQSNKGAEG